MFAEYRRTSPEANIVRHDIRIILREKPILDTVRTMHTHDFAGGKRGEIRNRLILTPGVYRDDVSTVIATLEMEQVHRFLKLVER